MSNFNWEKHSRIMKYLMQLKKTFFFFLCMYKMFKVTAETFAKNCVHTIKVNKAGNNSVLWIKMIDIQKTQDVKNIHDLVDKEITDKLRLIIEQMNEPKSIKYMDQN